VKVLVCGGRNYFNRIFINSNLTFLHNEIHFTELIHGGAAGADTIAALWAYGCKIKVRPFYADWANHGRSAGIIRNKLMLQEGKPQLVVAFPGGRGTQHMKFIAQNAGIEVLELEDDRKW
jgi:hypothetical protein